MPIPRLIVDPPASSPLSFGLLSSGAIDLRTDASPHWRNGVTWQDLCNTTVGLTYDQCQTPVTGIGAPPTKLETAEYMTFGATPFTVYARVDCSAPGFWEDSERLGGEALRKSEEYAVESAFWSGSVGGQQIAYPHLAANALVEDSDGTILQSPAEVISGITQLDVVEGLGRLERLLSECLGGQRGVIHIPRELIPSFQAQYLLERSGQQLRTTNGNVVVAGTGYAGTGPDGTLPDDAKWIYGTGPLFGYQSRVHVNPPESTIDRTVNTVMAIAERTYVIGYSCCLVGVPITTGGIISGAPNIA